jgi:hypothetical protein
MDAIDASVRSNQQIILTQLDISSAFPTVNHTIFLQQLKELKIPPVIFSFFKHCFLHQQVLFFETAIPILISSQVGLPQGCPLSPIAFAIYSSKVLKSVNSIERSLTEMPPRLRYRNQQEREEGVEEEDIETTREKEIEEHHEEERPQKKRYGERELEKATAAEEEQYRVANILHRCQVPRCVAYLDDLFLIDSSPQECAASLETVLNSLV